MVPFWHGIFTDRFQAALPAAAAVEVFRNFTLLHDDIMDNAAVRRGKPSVYAKSVSYTHLDVYKRQPSFYRGLLSMAHPELETMEQALSRKAESGMQGWQGAYRRTDAVESECRHRHSLLQAPRQRQGVPSAHHLGG